MESSDKRAAEMAPMVAGSTPGGVPSASRALGVAPLGVDRLFLSRRTGLKMFPVDGGVLQNPLGDLEMRGVLDGDRMQDIAVERQDLRAGKRQQNRRVRRD